MQCRESDLNVNSDQEKSSINSNLTFSDTVPEHIKELENLGSKLNPTEEEKKLYYERYKALSAKELEVLSDYEADLITQEIKEEQNYRSFGVSVSEQILNVEKGRAFRKLVHSNSISKYNVPFNKLSVEKQRNLIEETGKQFDKQGKN